MASSSAFTKPPTTTLTRNLSTVSAVEISSGSERSPSRSPTYVREQVARGKENRQKSRFSKVMSSPSLVRRTRERLSYSYRRPSQDDHYACERKYYKLEKKYNRLKEQYETKCDEYATLLETARDRRRADPDPTSTGEGPIKINAHTSNPTTIPDKYLGLTRANAASRFPSIKFWTTALYKEDSPTRKKGTADVMEVTTTASAPSDENGSNNKKERCIPYAEYEDGSLMDEDTSAAVRVLLRQIFNEMGDRLPAKWGEVSLTDSQYVYSQLYAHYPCFLLCHDNWKANLLVGRNLTMFQGTRKKKQRRLGQKEGRDVKIEPKVEDHQPSEDGGDAQPTEEGLIDSGKKRKSGSDDDNEAPPSKRLHPEPPRPPPPSPLRQPPPPPSPLCHQSPQVPLAPSSTRLGSPPIPPTSPPVSSSPTSAPPSSSFLPIPSSPMSSPPLAPLLPSNRDMAVGALATQEKPTLFPLSNNDSIMPTASNGQDPGPAQDSDKITIVNPLVSKFGVPTAPTKRVEALRKTREAQQQRKNGDVSKTIPTEVPDSSGNVSLSTAPNSGLKKVTKSVAAKNLCYIAYLETNDAVTPAAFDKYWKGLPKDEIKKWNDLSKSKKAAGSTEEKENEEN